MRQIRLRPSKPASALAAFVGVVFVLIGIGLASYVFPSEAPWFMKAFIGFWTLVAASICLYHCINVFSSRGVANEVFEIDDYSSAPRSPEERLRQLSELRAKQLITEAEYEEKRRAILNGL